MDFLLRPHVCDCIAVCTVGQSLLSRILAVSDKEPPGPIISPVSELTLYSGTNLTAIVRQLKFQLSRDDPDEEFKVS